MIKSKLVWFETEDPTKTLYDSKEDLKAGVKRDKFMVYYHNEHMLACGKHITVTPTEILTWLENNKTAVMELLIDYAPPPVKKPDLLVSLYRANMIELFTKNIEYNTDPICKYVHCDIVCPFYGEYDKPCKLVGLSKDDKVKAVRSWLDSL